MNDSDEPPAPPAVAAAPWQPPATGAPGVLWAPRSDVVALHTGVNAATAGRRLHMTAWSVALEFLPAERVISAKSVSKEMRGAARLVLTRGRYRPVTRWLELLSLYISIGRDSYDDPYYDPYASWHSITGTEEVKPIIRAAWLLEPSLVVEAVFQTDVHPDLIRWAMQIFEPSFDGLERIVAAMERACSQLYWSDPSELAFAAQLRLHSSPGESFFAEHWSVWVRQVGTYTTRDDERGYRSTAIKEGHMESAKVRLFNALQNWSDPHRIARVLMAAHGKEFKMMPFGFVERAVALMVSWEDVIKRDEVLLKIQAAAVAKDQRTQEAWARLHERARTAAAETTSASDY